jgi:rubredoxin
MTYEEFRRKHPAVRCMHHHSSEDRANLASSFRLTRGQREAVGEFFYVHDLVPDKAFPTAKAATTAAYAIFLKNASAHHAPSCGKDCGDTFACVICKRTVGPCLQNGEVVERPHCSSCGFIYDEEGRVPCATCGKRAWEIVLGKALCRKCIRAHHEMAATGKIGEP